jgi:two-component system alkaline phosphatase synthesis response regulator PhoP
MTRWCLVVEDELPLAEMICDNLRLEGWGVEHIARGDDALERLARGGIDLVILDVMLPGCDGFSVLRGLRGRGDRTPVLVLSARAADGDRIRGLELEADDYLTKPFNLRELLLRVAALARRREPLPAGADVLRFAGNEVDFRAREAVTWDGRRASLSDREVRLLRLLAGRDGTVVTRREIVVQLYGQGVPPTARTLDNIVLNLRRLFERDGQQPRHLHTVRGVGWRFTS